MQLEMRLSEHPRASAGIRRTKGAAGLLAFLLVGLLSVRSGGLGWDEAGIRALGSGLVVYFVAWGAAVSVWRQIALAELEQARRRREARLESLHALADEA